jgi:3-oxoacyl-[acyl-carrier-protein] synthase-3
VTALDAVATYLPPERVPIASLADDLDLTTMEVRILQRMFGLDEIRIDRGRTLEDLLSAAVSNLDALRGNEHRVRYVLHARSMPVAVPYPVNPVHALCREVGLAHAVAFTVTQQACASGLLAIDLAGRLLAGGGDPDALALVLSGEKTFTWDARLIPGTTVFGEGSAACLVSQGGPRNRLLSYVTRAYSQFDGRMSTMPELTATFNREYPDMLGEALLGAVSRAGLRLDDIALVLPHNVNSVSWRRLCRTLGIPAASLVLDNLPIAGHSFCADAFLNYRTAIDQGRLHPGDRYLVAAVGSGATFSAMVFEH